MQTGTEPTAQKSNSEVSKRLCTHFLPACTLTHSLPPKNSGSNPLISTEMLGKIRMVYNRLAGKLTRPGTNPTGFFGPLDYLSCNNYFNLKSDRNLIKFSFR